MATKDRSKNRSATGPKTSKKKGTPGSKASSNKTEVKTKPKVPAQTSIAKKPTKTAEAQSLEPKAPTTKKQAQDRPQSRSAGAKPKHRPLPLHPGIDAMAILERAETEKRTLVDADAVTGKLGTPLSAAQVIAKSTARDHPDKGTERNLQESVEVRKAPKPKPVRRTEVPVEPKAPIGSVGAEGLPPPLVDGEAVAAILNADHGDPFSFLGMHEVGPKGRLVVRAFLPGVDRVEVVDTVGRKSIAELVQAHDEGLFVGEIEDRTQPFAYRLRITTDLGETLIDDPYRFPPVLSDKDTKQLTTGEHLASYQVLGAHPAEKEGVKGVTFAAWAPQASHVSVVGDFNDWDGRRHGMRLRVECGVWEIFLPGVATGALYKYEVKHAPGTVPEIKSDPYAFFAERPPGLASIVQDIDEFEWRDAAWMKGRKRRQGADAPLSFYELHLGSWRRKPEEDNRYLTYRELADELVNHVSDLGFTHIALLPVSEHTHDGTLGYLPSALYAPTSRFGTPDDFRYLVDSCHRAGIGVVADWVPNLLSEEPQGLARFDGTRLFEHPDPHQGRDPDWNVPVYDLGRPQVVNYLLDNALYWIDRFHLDGLRIDGLAKMLYLDYGRGDGEWTPNRDGGNDNLEAVAFVQRFNERVAGNHPGAMTIAEDSSLRQGVTRPVEDGGLGFDFRWNPAWVYDTLRYLGRNPVHRKYYQFELTNPLLHAFDEHFVLPVSHEHVSMGQGSMVNKLPDGYWEKFATLRAWYALMYMLPGKKLMFMGTEFAQDREWNSDISLDWHLLDNPMHLGVQRLVRDLNEHYRERSALHERDSDPRGFEWIDFGDEDNGVIAFIRYNKERNKPLVVVTHFTPVLRPDYRIGVPEMGRYKEIINTDAEAYGGGNAGSGGGVTAEFHYAHGREQSVSLTLPPYATVVLELEKK